MKTSIYEEVVNGLMKFYKEGKTISVEIDAGKDGKSVHYHRISNITGVMSRDDWFTFDLEDGCGELTIYENEEITRCMQFGKVKPGWYEISLGNGGSFRIDVQKD